MHRRPIIFTDLDGTLLDHHTYSYAPASQILEKLKSRDIPVIANTSKTYAELTEIRHSLELTAPFIVENGAAVYIPEHTFSEQPQGTTLKHRFWIKEFSSPVSHWLSILKELEKDFSGAFDHFSNMSIQRISEVTGLDALSAEQAKQRQYGEPVHWLGDDKTKRRFIHALKEKGAHILEGGRFLHVSGPCDKGIALNWLKQIYDAFHPQNQYISIALGDGKNDIAMLEVADISVKILSPANAPPQVKKSVEVYTSKDYGPTGWAQCVEDIIFSSTSNFKL